ncbi:MAG TPA: DUF1801 domain-containing protein [Bacteroidales bacterium]|nr:DUF1801 domain-containing protein [Bacteroidales bacterium]
MTVKDQIKNYIASLPEAKASEMQSLHKLVLKIAPKSKLWFEDGKDASGKTVSNPNIGYGTYTIQYANGKTKEFFRVGISANTSGISVYIMGLEDKSFLSKTYGKKIGKASVTGYCIKFKSVEDVDLAVLKEVIAYRLGL